MPIIILIANEWMVHSLQDAICLTNRWARQYLQVGGTVRTGGRPVRTVPDPSMNMYKQSHAYELV